MSMPRRQKLLLGVFLVLLVGGTGYSVYRWRQSKQHAAHWAAMFGRAEEHQRFNASGLQAVTQQAAAAPEAKLAVGPQALIEPLNLLWKDSEWEGKLLSTVDGCLPIAPDTDLVWRDNDLFSMKQPGRLELLWSDPSGSALSGTTDSFGRHRGQPCFDGRYVWLVPRNGFRRVMVIDPAEQKAWEFGSEATGLFTAGGARTSPQTATAAFGAIADNSEASLDIGLAPVRPGVVCAFFGPRQVYASSAAWLALLHFDADGERREVEPIDLPQAMDLSSHVEQMFALETNVAGQPTRRIVVGREWMSPLALDPSNRQISAASVNSSLVGFRIGHWCLHDGAIWWQRKIATDDRVTTLCKANLPDLKEQVVLSGIPPALLASHERGLILVGEDCWLVKPEQGTLERLDAECFWTFSDRLEPMPAGRAGAPNVAGITPPPIRKQDTDPSIDDFFSTPPENVLAPGRRSIRPTALYPSAVYGLLLEASPQSGGWSELYCISLDRAARNDASVRRPVATTSRLTLSTRRSEPAGSRVLARLTGAAEPDRIDWRQRLPVLARELVRQSLLLALDAELGCLPFDEALGESPGSELATRAEFVLASWFRDDGVGEVSLQSAEGDDAEPIWRKPLELLNDGGVFDYRRLAELAERWSREDFPKLLRASLSNEEPKEIGPRPPVEATDAVEQKLAAMSLVPQFAAVRAYGRAVSPDQPDHRLGYLVRGYSHLGLLTEHHWTMAHKVFQARALLHAQRWVARAPTSPEALWHRAYAEALAGLPGDALDDIAKADQLDGGQDAASVSRPAWVDVIAASCRGDDNALASFGDNEQLAELAGLLRFLHLSRLYASVLASEAGKKLTERQPECDRAYNAMCDCCLPEELRASTATALSVLQDRLPSRVRELPGLPDSVVELFAGEQGALTERLATALLDARESDGGSVSWQILGALVRESLFIDCWRRAHFFRFQVGEEVGDFLASAAPLVAHHPCRGLLDFYADAPADGVGHAPRLDQRRQTAAAELLDRLDLANLSETQQRIIHYFVGQAWQVRRPQHYVAALWRPVQHRDDAVGDLLDQMDLAKRERLLPLVYDEFNRAGRADNIRVASIDGNSVATSENLRRLRAIGPESPDAIAAGVRANLMLAWKLFDPLFEQYQNSPHVLGALATMSDYRVGNGLKALRAYVQLSPDAWAYGALARSYLDQGQIDQWQALLDEYLARQPDDEQATVTRLEMANVFLARGQCERALPYAEAAANKKSEAAMGCLIRCYQCLGDDAEEGVWHERIVDRFPSAANSREHYLWSRRTGLGDSRVLADRALVRIGQGQVFAMPVEQMRYAAFYWLLHRLDDAIRCYQWAAGQQQGNPAFCYLCISLINEEKGDAAARDEALAQMPDSSAPEIQHFQTLKEWLETGLAAKSLDVDLAQQLAAAAPRNDQPAMNFLIGYALLLSRQSEDGVPFLQTAATLNQGAGAASRTLASAALRDRGLIPGRLHEPSE